MLSPPHGGRTAAWPDTKHSPRQSDGVDAPVVARIWFGSRLGSTVQGERWCPAPLGGKAPRLCTPVGGRPEPLSLHGGRAVCAGFGCLPIKQSWSEGASPLRPRGRTRLAGLWLLRGWTAREWVSHNNSTGRYLHISPAWIRHVEQTPWRAEFNLFSATKWLKRRVLAKNDFSALSSFLLTSQGALFLWLFLLKDFYFVALWIEIQSSDLSRDTSESTL